MNDALIYFLKVNIAIALFYLFFRLAFYHDTFWKTRRFYLLFSMLLSVVYPLISLTGWLEKQESMQAIMVNYVQLQGITVNGKETPTSILTIENIVLAAYALVSIILLVKMMVQLISILRWRLKGEKQLLQGIEIVAIDKAITPFSFFNTIFINPALHNESETSQILAHERTHAQQMHSLDVLISEMLTIACWINPAAWLLKREIRQNLEFLADNSVIESGFDSKNYQYHLLQLSYQTPEVKLGNKFNVSPLKKRIIMMNQQKTRKAGILKYSLIVPLALALVLSSNAQTVVNKAKAAFDQTQDSVTKKKQLKFTSPKTPKNSVKFTPPTIVEDKSGVYSVVEKMPQYPGGEKKLLEYLGTNIRYPVEAQKNDQQGTTIVQFVVNAQGKVEKAKVLRSISSSLDQEALRVINSLPDFIPGEQSGKMVSVYYTLPITFKLDGGSKPAPSTESSSIVVVGYAKQTSGLVAPKVKEFGSSNPPVFIVDGVIQSKGFDMNTIKPATIEKVNVVRPDTEAKKAELVAKYGENATNGVIEITKKK
ncbi:MAG TPA: TonB family protein [Paludibacter sp.]|nr:TonB family protein [Paludibacter sp.]